MVHGNHDTEVGQMYDKVYSWLTEFQASKTKEEQLTKRKKAPGHHWQAPPLGSLKLNVDAATGDGNNGTGLGAVI